MTTLVIYSIITQMNIKTLKLNILPLKSCFSWVNRRSCINTRPHTTQLFLGACVLRDFNSRLKLRYSKGFLMKVKFMNWKLYV